MNRCSKSLFLKGLNSNPMSWATSIQNQLSNLRILSNVMHYSFFDRKYAANYHKKLNYNDTRTFKVSAEDMAKNTKRPRKNTQIEPKKTLEVLHKALEIEPLKKNPAEEHDVGLELGGKLTKSQINQILVDFKNNEQVGQLVLESGLNSRMFSESLLSFRKFCMQSTILPADLHIKLSDIAKGFATVVDLYPFYLRHVHDLYPHLHCMDDLKQISDLTEPCFWYLETRDIKRKIIYHCGPTNSGKTYSALKAFQMSSSGIYCGPLKLLANEVFFKTNNAEVFCDLVTGEERRFGQANGNEANHMACTIEMANLQKEYDVAVIDEIQMIKDGQRGWAWTRAFLGLRAKEIHLCGDPSVIDLLSDLCFITNDEFEVKQYERLTKLSILDKAVEKFENVEPGDCFVCFNKNDIFTVALALEKLGHEVAVIYGSMPPMVKTAQANKFNDPDHKCKVLVATDAVGMGLNLNIRRIVFYDLIKPTLKLNKNPTERNEISLEYINTSQALQIAGRAGRFGTQFSDGYVTTFAAKDLPILKNILNQKLEKTVKAGLHPTADQIELFAYHLPNHSLSDLIKIFMSICRLDDGQYFMCKFDDIIFLAEVIDHMPIKIKDKYTFATSPISRRDSFVITCFVKFVRSFSVNEPVTPEVLEKMLDWPPKDAKKVTEINHLESIYDVLDLYLWLGQRFPDIYSYFEHVKNLRLELEEKIQTAIQNLFLERKAPSSSNNKAAELKTLTFNDNELVGLKEKVGSANLNDKLIKLDMKNSERLSILKKELQKSELKQRKHPATKPNVSSVKDKKKKLPETPIQKRISKENGDKNQKSVKPFEKIDILDLEKNDQKRSADLKQVLYKNEQSENPWDSIVESYPIKKIDASKIENKSISQTENNPETKPKVHDPIIQAKRREWDTLLVKNSYKGSAKSEEKQTPLQELNENNDNFIQSSNNEKSANDPNDELQISMNAMLSDTTTSSQDSATQIDLENEFKKIIFDKKD